MGVKIDSVVHGDVMNHRIGGIHEGILPLQG